MICYKLQEPHPVYPFLKIISLILRRCLPRFHVKVREPAALSLYFACITHEPVDDLLSHNMPPIYYIIQYGTDDKVPSGVAARLKHAQISLAFFPHSFIS